VPVEDKAVIPPLHSERWGSWLDLPAKRCRRDFPAGLDAHLLLWIILNEYHQDTIGRSFYLAPEPPLGRFGSAIMQWLTTFQKEAIGRQEGEWINTLPPVDQYRHYCSQVLTWP
jgi:hypothetical protein